MAKYSKILYTEYFFSNFKKKDLEKKLFKFSVKSKLHYFYPSQVFFYNMNTKSLKDSLTNIILQYYSEDSAIFTQLKTLVLDNLNKIVSTKEVENLIKKLIYIIEAFGDEDLNNSNYEGYTIWNNNYKIKILFNEVIKVLENFFETIYIFGLSEKPLDLKKPIFLYGFDKETSKQDFENSMKDFSIVCFDPFESYPPKNETFYFAYVSNETQIKNPKNYILAEKINRGLDLNKKIEIHLIDKFEKLNNYFIFNYLAHTIQMKLNFLQKSCNYYKINKI